MLVHIVADYGAGDLAFAEVVQALRLHLPDAEVVLTPVPPFATLAAGFCVAQLALNQAPAGTIVYHNVAPREDDPAVREGNAGERLAFARLKTGVRVVGVAAGYTYSFLKDAAEELRWVNCAAQGSQFRSRDVFPQAAGAIALGAPDILGDVIKPAEFPDLPAAAVAYFDGYGNIKTTIPGAEAATLQGKKCRVRIGEVEREVVAGDGSFSVEPGQIAFAPGSSGWPLEGGGDHRWVELFFRGGNAWEEFGRPKVGAPIEIIPSR